MTLPIITQSTYSGNDTQLGLLDAFDTALTGCGFTFVSNLTAGSNIGRVWTKQLSNAGQGTLFLELLFTNTNTLRVRFSRGFDANTNSVVFVNGTSPTLALNLSSEFNFIRINHSEMCGTIFIENTNIRGFVGYFRPPKPSAWDEDEFAYAFVPRTFNGWSTDNLQTISAQRPAGVGQVIDLSSATAANPIPFNNNKRVLFPAILTNKTTPSSATTTSTFYISTFSDNFLLGSSFGLNIFDTLVVNPGVEEYMLIDGSTSNLNTRLFIRIV